jgi:hypothetical protein
MKQTILNLILCLCVGVGLIFLGCGSKGAQLSSTTNNEGAREVQILEPHPDGTDGFLYAIGISKSRDLSMARSMAMQRARANMALKAKTQVTALSKDFQQQLGVGEKAKVNAVFSQVSEGLADETLIGTTIITTKAMEKDGLYDVQLMLGMPIKSNIENPLVEEISQDAALYQEFQAWKGHNELAEKVKDLREREEKQ